MTTRTHRGLTPIDYESCTWAPDATTYQAAIPAHVATFDMQTVDPAALMDSTDAERRLAVSDARWTAALGDTELGTIEAMLLRTEAASSSQIENITAGAAQVSAAVIGVGQSSKVNARQVANNVAAMRQATRLAGEMTVDALLDMHHALLPDLGRGARTEQVWIGTSSTSPKGAAFVPPHHHRVPEYLEDLMTFCRRPGHMPLARAALAHAQFETIHPFTDGNGRLGRALVHAMLHRSGLAQHLTVPVSAGLLADTDSYEEALTAHRQGRPEPIVARFAQATRDGIDAGQRLLDEVAAVRAEWAARVKARRGSTARRALDVLPAQPVVTTNYLADVLKVSMQAATVAVDVLVEAGVLTKLSVGSRNRVWVAREIADAFDVAAAGGKRRTEFRANQ